MGDAHCDLEVLIVSVSLKGKANDVLETFHQCTIADTPLVLAVVGIDVGNKDCDTAVGFYLLELFGQPSELVAGVRSLA